MQFITATAKSFRDMVKKENKYHAKKTKLGDITFDSKKESRDWQQLCMLEACGIISNLRRQVHFELQPAYVNNQGKKIRAIEYVADFVYKKDDKIYVQDSKGGKATQTDIFRLKKKLFEYKFPGYIFVIS